MKTICQKTLHNTGERSLYIDMRYLVELDTIAGTITLGTFDTIEAARKYLAGTRGRICPIWPPVIAAADLIESYSANDLDKKLQTISNSA